MAFEAAWATHDLRLLPAGLPRWLLLHWLGEQGWLVHGSAQPHLTLFEPRSPHDLSADEFSKRTGVFATSDSLWAMMYALRDRVRTARMLNTAVQVQRGGHWSRTQYFLSLAPRRPLQISGPELLAPGWVYVLPRTSFEPMPPYDWPGLGHVREPHWVSPHATAPLLRVLSSSLLIFRSTERSEYRKKYVAPHVTTLQESTAKSPLPVQRT
ncbi:hypothetical protein C8263_13115 [Deinococcus arcticus]|uniref:Uncharacterized protein n=2 Tax=Deinococcus arcticus TaxID=2136176 RepID=A0A2T3W5T8_9DEIO|nr:hypothetical protein C8263_13115 [Deinococcus arcticus]